MTNRINLLLEPETTQSIKKCQVFMREKHTTTTIRWLIESSLIYIDEGKVSPIVELLHQNKEAVKKCQAEHI